MTLKPAFPKPGAKQRNKERKALEKFADRLVREIVFRRDGHRCVKCGSEKALAPAHVYPRWFRKLRWMPINILTLCYPCHMIWWHRNTRAASKWFEEKYPERALQLDISVRNAVKVDLPMMILALQIELDGEA